MIKLFEEFLNKSLEYKTIFNKKVSHIDSLKETLISNFISINMELNEISEKSFLEIDKISSYIKNNFNEEILEEANNLYNNNKRISFISEYLYDKYFLNNKLNEDQEELTKIEILYRGDNDFIEMLKYIKFVGQLGHSFNIEIDPDNKKYSRKFGFDGDGSDYIKEIKINDIIEK